MTGKEQKEEHEKEPFPGKIFVIQWWRRSKTYDSAVCGYVFNDPDQNNGFEDGSYHRIHIDQPFNLNNVQDRTMVSTGCSQIKLGVRCPPSTFSDHEIDSLTNSDEDTIKLWSIRCKVLNKEILKLKCLGGTNPNSPRHAEMLKCRDDLDVAKEILQASKARLAQAQVLQ